MPKVSKKTAERLTAVKKYILKYPERYDQSAWHCRTGMCIAGTALHLFPLPNVQLAVPNDIGAYVHPEVVSLVLIDKDGHEVSWYEAAAKTLGTTAERLDNLFEAAPSCDWPEPFSSRYYEADTRTARAKVAAARIDHFIATGK